MGIRHRFLLAAALVYLVAANLIWIARDTRPPYWDMADKQISALNIYDAVSASGIRAISAIPFLSGAYPPLYPSIIAAFYSAFGRTADAALWANIPAIVLLLAATYAIGSRVLKPVGAAAAAMIVTFLPLLLWLSRESMIDYWLTSVVALAMWMLVRTDEFSDRTRSIIFGVVCGLGMLTKWTFVFFVILPALWFARKNLRNALVAAVAAAAVSAYWYAFAIRNVLQLLSAASGQSLIEADPDRFSFAAVVFYVRALEGSQLFLPLFVAFLAGLVLLIFDFNREWAPVVLWILGGWVGLLLFQNKDPRYTAPLLPAVALISAQVFQRKQALLAALVPLLLMQHYLVSFGIPWLPREVVLAKGGEGVITYDWNLYTQNYFGWGAPAQEDWKIDYVLKKIAPAGNAIVRLGIVPDIPRFDVPAFVFTAKRDKTSVAVTRLVVFDELSLRNNDYILISEKVAGFEAGSYFTSDLPVINRFVTARTDIFHRVDSFTLPNGDLIHLYRVKAS